MNGALRVEDTSGLHGIKPAGALSDYADLGAYLVQHLGAGRCRSCRPVSTGRKVGKRFVEFEVVFEDPMEEGIEPEQRLYVGKIYRHGRGKRHFDALMRLRAAGFSPPSPFTVVLPVAYIPERRLLFQEKAQGRLLVDILFDRPDVAESALARTVEWLVALHAAPVKVPARIKQVRANLTRFGRELAEFIPAQARRVEQLTNCALAGLQAPHLTPLVPSHGDFHPTNVFIDGGRVTVIDLDTFGLQERMADVAYFLLQTAIMGYLRTGSFASTARIRDCFLQSYLDAVPLPRERVALYMGIGFLQSLHYELCVLHDGKASIIEPWLGNSERCLTDGEVTLADLATAQVRR